MPACDSGLLFEAKEASENAMNRTSEIEMGWIVILTSLCFFAL